MKINGNCLNNANDLLFNHLSKSCSENKMSEIMCGCLFRDEKSQIQPFISLLQRLSSIEKQIDKIDRKSSVLQTEIILVQSVVEAHKASLQAAQKKEIRNSNQELGFFHTIVILSQQLLENKRDLGKYDQERELIIKEKKSIEEKIKSLTEPVKNILIINLEESNSAIEALNKKIHALDFCINQESIKQSDVLSLKQKVINKNTTNFEEALFLIEGYLFQIFRILAFFNKQKQELMIEKEKMVVESGLKKEKLVEEMSLYSADQLARSNEALKHYYSTLKAY
jgi:hypothetical protein